MNSLTPAQLERLALLAEECGEVVQIINKIIRHGYNSWHPNDPEMVTNRRLLEKELGDMSFALALMSVRGDISLDSIEIAKEQKKKNIGIYLHHNNVN